MEIETVLGVYTVVSHLSVGALVSFYALTQASLFSFLRKLLYEKISILILGNSLAATGILAAYVLLKLTVVQLRDLEAEALTENFKQTLLDAVLFLVLASPTLDGDQVPHSILLSFLSLILILKAFHHLCKIRIAHMLEAGVGVSGSVASMTALSFSLLLLDGILLGFSARRAGLASSFFLWILFETLSLITTVATSLAKISVLFVDISLEASTPNGTGWPHKNEYILCLDVAHELGTLGIFLTFLVVFFISNPSRLPIYLVSDILQVVRALIHKIRSFQRYRRLAVRLQVDFPEPTLLELEEADTCIVCRDILTIGSKKLACGHILHLECLKGWFVQHQSCPTCRAEIPAQRSGRTDPSRNSAPASTPAPERVETTHDGIYVLRGHTPLAPALVRPYRNIASAVVGRRLPGGAPARPALAVRGSTNRQTTESILPSSTHGRSATSQGQSAQRNLVLLRYLLSQAESQATNAEAILNSCSVEGDDRSVLRKPRRTRTARMFDSMRSERVVGGTAILKGLTQ